MQELELAIKTLAKVRETTYTLEKHATLHMGDSPTLRYILTAAYNDAHYGFGKEAKTVLHSLLPATPVDAADWWAMCVHAFENSGSTGHWCNLVQVAPDQFHRELLIGILTKDLRIGMGKTLVLRVFPGLFDVFAVQLAHPFNESKLHFPCVVEPKYDGVRAIYINGQYFSRYGKTLQGPTLTGVPADVVLDGELTGKNFQEALSSVRVGGRLSYVVFDFMSLNEWNTKSTLDSFLKRRYALLALRANHARGFEVIDWQTADSLVELNEVHADHVARGFEGSMVKSLTHYEWKRSHSWMKIKPTKEMDVEVVGVLAGTGKFAGGLGAFICRTSTDAIVHVGTGFTDRERFSPDIYRCKIMEITYQELTLDGVPRFARFKRWRPDKEAL